MTAHFSRLVERHTAGEYTRAKALPKESPFGRSQTLKSNRLRQPANRARANQVALRADTVRLTYCDSSANLVCDPKLPGQENPTLFRGRKGSSL